MNNAYTSERIDSARKFPTDSTSPHTAALMYLAMGLDPVAIHGVRDDGTCTCARGKECNGSTGKHPRTNAWQSVDVTDALVRQWFGAWPDSNIGLRMGGAQRLVALDVDGEKGRRTLAALEDRNGPLPATLTSKSGRIDGGTHLVFRCQAHQDPSRVVNRTGKSGLGEGLDVRGPGAQIVVAPSVHSTGNRYRWQDTREPAELPDWLYELMVERPEPSKAEPRPPRKTSGNRASAAERASKYVATMPAAIAGSGGHAAAFEVAAVLCRGFSLSEAEAFDIFWSEYNSRCQPPWSRKEVEHKIREGMKADREDGYLLDADRPGWSAPPPPQNSRQAVNDNQGVPRAEAWMQDLIGDRRGNLTNCLANVKLFFTHHPEWRGAIRFDDFSHRTVIAHRTPICKPGAEYPREWTDADDVNAACWFQRKGMNVTPDCVAKATVGAGSESSFHPVREYLDSLEWDHELRLDSWLINYLGAPDKEHIREMGLRWMISAIARVRKPGCKADYALIFEGVQDLKKSTALNVLGGEWFCDGLADLGSKAAQEQMQGKWIIELAELTQIGRADNNTAKAFITSRTDRFRAAYGRRPADYPRQCVFSGTTNDDGWLKDPTGGRRFWPVPCSKIDIVGLEKARDQLWAEADHYFRHGSNWWIENADIKAQLVTEQEQRYSADSWEPDIRKWLLTHPNPTTGEVLGEALGIKLGEWSNADSQRVGRILRHLGLAPRGRDRRYEPV